MNYHSADHFPFQNLLKLKRKLKIHVIGKISFGHTFKKLQHFSIGINKLPGSSAQTSAVIKTATLSHFYAYLVGNLSKLKLPLVMMKRKNYEMK